MQSLRSWGATNEFHPPSWSPVLNRDLRSKRLTAQLQSRLLMDSRLHGSYPETGFGR